MEVVEHQDIFWSDQRIFVIMKKGLAKLQTIGNIFNLTMRLLTYLQNKQRKEKTKTQIGLRDLENIALRANRIQDYFL